ncbi:hypothetical protein PV08_02020 [Exophiala spinifera]|uniref:Uncharacterized protein n=1 Tax=Exophiala spinifera TaxID=91928 RepID=A0A0D2BSP0_9EURO|nr:uncharacterized protein PV08_02020 [Exophiala spinifera]KIW21440.1 hypothetical protein PV08_02020 [Exophiala spinifera]
MEYAPLWNYSLPETAYNPASMSVSSYFARPNRVVKPSSRNSSPRNSGRRKTTTGATLSSRTRSLVDHLRSRSQQQPDFDNSRSRPVSWHTTYDGLHIPFDSCTPEYDSSAWDFTTTQVNGLVTPISHPVMNEPQIQELMTPLDEVNAANIVIGHGSQHCLNQVWHDDKHSKFDRYTFAPFDSSLYSSQPAMVSGVATAPPSPSYPSASEINVQDLSLDSSDGKAQDNREELVGMGLYDSPAQVQSSSLLLGNFAGSGQTSLKLAESFEPVEWDPAADQDGEAEGDDDDDEVEMDEDIAQQHNPTPLDTSATMFSSYDSQSVANHMAFPTPSGVDPLAYKYLATLSQLNSAYYPNCQYGYGWI